MVRAVQFSCCSAKLHFFHSYGHQPRDELKWVQSKIYGYGIMNISWKSAILKKWSSNWLNSDKPLTQHLKGTFSRFRVSPGKAETLVRWGGKTNHHLIAYILSRQRLCQKLPQSVDVRWSYSMQHQCRLLETLSHHTVVKRWLITKTSHSSHLTTKAVSNIKRTLKIKWYYLCSGRKGIRPVKTELWGACVVICLERGADLHMAQLMPLPLTVSCFSKIQIGFTFLVPAHPGSPGHGAVKRVCVCVCVWYYLCLIFVMSYIHQQPFFWLTRV